MHIKTTPCVYTVEKHCTELAQLNVSAERRGRNNKELLWSHRVIFILTGNTDPTAAWDSRRYREEEGRWQETSSSCRSAKRGESQDRLILSPYFLPRSHREKPLDNRPPAAYFAAWERLGTLSCSSQCNQTLQCRCEGARGSQINIFLRKLRIESPSKSSNPCCYFDVTKWNTATAALAPTPTHPQCEGPTLCVYCT